MLSGRSSGSASEAPALLEELGGQLDRARGRLSILSAVVGLLLALTVIHEIFMHVSPPGFLAYKAVHIGLLAFGLLSISILWLFWGTYRSLRVHQRAVTEEYIKLDQVVHDRTQDLRSSQSLLKSLIDAIDNRIVVVSHDDRIALSNRAAREEVGGDPCGRHFRETFPDCTPNGERRSEFRLIEHTFRTRRPQRSRLVSGGRACGRILEIDTFPVLDEKGDPSFVIELARDVTEEKEDEALASHYEKMSALGLLAAGIAHDLGNPLASLSSELQMLRREQDLERIRQSLHTLERHIERITRSVHDMLGFARTRNHPNAKASLATAIKDALRLLRHDRRAKSVRFQIDVPEDLAPIAMKEDDLVLVLLNIAVNAIDAMPSGGKILVYAQPLDQDHTALKISDTGMGMDAETLARATKPLFTTKPDTGGTGLGLAVADTLMRRVGGALTLDSAPGQGTTVTLQLPLRGRSLQRHARSWTS